MNDAVRHVARPELLGGVLAPFRLSWRDRLVARTLVRLVRFRPVIRLLARWHGAATRKN